MNKINILFVTIQMTLGGSEQLVLSLIKNINRDRYSPSLAWFFGDPLDEFTSLNIPLYHVPKVKSFDIQAMKSMAKIIAENNIQIVNAHHFMSMVYSFYGCKTNKAKLVYTEHSEWEIEKIKPRWKFIGKGLLKLTEKTVGVTPEVSDCLRKNFSIPHSRITTIKNGVDLQAFSNKQNVSEIKKQIGINDDEYVIGIVANLKKVKNHLFLLKAFKKLTEEHEKVKLLLIGQSFEGDPESTEKEIKDFISANNLTEKVLMLGYRSDIPLLLNILDIFCLTSNMEGLPISIIEAMAAGLPIIGTDVPGIKGVVKHGYNGFLVPTGNVAELTSTFLTLFKDEALRSSMGDKSRREAKRYSLAHCVNEYENLFVT